MGGLKPSEALFLPPWGTERWGRAAAAARKIKAKYHNKDKQKVVIKFYHTKF
jgi:hypothetical protein